MDRRTSWTARRAVLLVLPLLQACVMVPRTVHEVDPRCGTTVRRMELEPVQIAAISGCSNDGCVVLLAAAGVTAAVSTIVSGSIAIAGNAVYWLERQGANQPACSKP